jgi:hypothetical protein
MSDASEPYWKTLNTINEWVRFLDAKATAVLAADAAIAAGLLGLLKDTAKDAAKSGLTLLLAAAAVLCLFISGVYCLNCISPTLNNRFQSFLFLFNPLAPPSPTGEATSLLFFDHIARNDKFGEQAKEKLSNPETLKTELIVQIKENAKVARDKSLQVGKAIQCLSLALVLGMLATLLFWLIPPEKGS